MMGLFWGGGRFENEKMFHHRTNIHTQVIVLYRQPLCLSWLWLWLCCSSVIDILVFFYLFYFFGYWKLYNVLTNHSNLLQTATVFLYESLAWWQSTSNVVLLVPVGAVLLELVSFRVAQFNVDQCMCWCNGQNFWKNQPDTRSVNTSFLSQKYSSLLLVQSVFCPHLKWSSVVPIMNRRLFGETEVSAMTAGTIVNIFFSFYHYFIGCI